MKPGKPCQRATLFLAIMLLVLAAVPQGSLAADTGTSSFEVIDRNVENQMDASRVPGVAVSIVEGGDVVYSRGYGKTSRGETVSDQTLFSIGSTTKSMTALAVMQLVEAGQIELDAPVQMYLPRFRLADPAVSGEVTVRHLLTMTSGIPANAGGEAFRSTEPRTSEQAIQSLQPADFAHPPGSTFEYVNANYVILGHLIEVVSGQSYGDYLQDNIFDPLEMNDTYTDLTRAEAAGFAEGHRYWFGLPVPYGMQELPALVPAGYVVSTADDLSNYLVMYLNDGRYLDRQILSPSGIETMLTGVIPATLGPWADGASAEYAMGWYVGGPWADGKTIFHPGSEPNFTAMLMLDPANELGVVTLMNASTELPLPGASGTLRELPSGVMSLLVGEEPIQGSGLARFYLYFDLIVAAFILVQVVALVRLLRSERGVSPNPGARYRALRYVRSVTPLIWELGLGSAMFLLPSLLGMSWKSMWLWTPDLGVVLAAIGALWITTGFVRLWKLGVVSKQNRLSSIGRSLRERTFTGEQSGAERRAG